MKKITKVCEVFTYDELSPEAKEENFRSLCEANDYNFLANGKLVNY